MANVAFIGAGEMGGRLARRVKQAGHNLIVCDLSLAVLSAFSQEGATIAETPAGCASADVVIYFVATGRQAIEATVGSEGLMQGIDQERTPLVIIMSTILPREVLEIQGALVTKGVRVIDAPVTGGLTLAEQGRLTILVGGAGADIDAAEPFLKLMGQDILRCGQIGAGETLKIINNMVGLVNLYHSYESYRLGQAYGVEPETISKVLSKGTGATFWHSHAKDAVAQYDVVSRDPQYFRHVLHMSAENWGLAVSLGEDVGLKFPFLDAMISRVAEVDSGALWNEWRAFVEKAIQA